MKIIHNIFSEWVPGTMLPIQTSSGFCSIQAKWSPSILHSQTSCRPNGYRRYSQSMMRWKRWEMGPGHILSLTHWGRVTHKCVDKLTIIGSDNGLSPDRRQAIIWTNAGILLIGPIGTNFSEILIEILTFSFKKMRLKVSSANRRPFCLGLNVLTEHSPLPLVEILLLNQR